MKNENQIFGILLFGIGLFLCVDSGKFFYYYNFTNLLFVFMHPFYELCARFILGLLLIPTGIFIFLEKKQGLKLLYNTAWAMIIYGIIRFVINFDLWFEEFYSGFVYILIGVTLIGITKRITRYF